MSDQSPPFVAPRTTGPAVALGVVLALLLLALGVVLVHDALALFRVIQRGDWVSRWSHRIGTIGPTPQTAWFGVLLLVVGLFLVVTALRPRRRFGTPLLGGAGLYLQDRDVAMLASGVARNVDGVLEASSTVTPRAVTVAIRTTGDPATGEAVRAEVGILLGQLEPPPTVRVRTRGARS